MRVTFIASQQQLAVSPHLLGVSFRSFPLFFRVYLTLRNITVINTLFLSVDFFLVLCSLVITLPASRSVGCVELFRFGAYLLIEYFFSSISPFDGSVGSVR